MGKLTSEVGRAIGSVLGAKKPPTPQKPVVMPTADDEALQLARRRQVAAAHQRGGRASTILTPTGNNVHQPLGG
jgi:hypothetical protein